jgi:hypothetical protein
MLVAQILKHPMMWWLVNNEFERDVEGSGYDLIWHINPIFAWKDWGELHQNTLEYTSTALFWRSRLEGKTIQIEHPGHSSDSYLARLKYANSAVLPHLHYLLY